MEVSLLILFFSSTHGDSALGFFFLCPAANFQVTFENFVSVKLLPTLLTEFQKEFKGREERQQNSRKPL